MRVVPLIVCIALCMDGSISRAATPLPGDSTVAQHSVSPRESAQLSLEASAITASVSFAEHTGRCWLLGGGVGAGGAIGTMIVAGRHFSEADGWSYDEKDGYENKSLIDVVHGKLFVRYERSPRWYVDSGAYGSLFLHWDSSDDDPGGGSFVGGFVNPMFGWSSLKFGPRVLIGYFSEGGDTNEFGVFLAPLVGSVIFRF